MTLGKSQVSGKFETGMSVHEIMKYEIGIPSRIQISMFKLNSSLSSLVFSLLLL